jgi:hypothetical protein
MNGLQRQAANLQPIAGPHFVDNPGRRLCDDPSESDRDDENWRTGQTSKGRHVQVVPMSVADEHCGEIREGRLGSDGPLAPNDTGHVTEHRIREHANAVEIDKDGRMAEKRQPITHVASSWVRTLARLIEYCEYGCDQTAGRPSQTRRRQPMCQMPTAPGRFCRSRRPLRIIRAASVVMAT